MTALRWGILGTGAIASAFVSELAGSGAHRVVAVASHDPARALAFAGDHDIPNALDDYAALVAHPEVDVVYVAGIHTDHARWTVRAARAGKHVLSEKPLGTDVAEVMTAIEAARRNGVVLREGYMYRSHPRMRALLTTIAAGDIGTVRHIDAAYSFRTSAVGGRLLDPERAGGGVLDVGGYPASAALSVLRVARGASVDPVIVEADGSRSDAGVDLWSTARLEFPGEASARLATGVGVAIPSRLTIHGSRGLIDVADPWRSRPGELDRFTVSVVGEDPREVETPGVAPYLAEADDMADAIAAGWDESTAAEMLALARVLTRWRGALNVVYPWETSGSTPERLSGEPLRRLDDRMRFGSLPGVDIPISRLLMGCDNQRDIRFAAAMFDDFVERGGNAFDTAYEYSGRLQEKLLGQWMTDRGMRSQVAVVGKGAHTPYCDPENLEKQLLATLEDLQTDYLDVYFMHRDNEQVPVGEFVDVLDRYHRAGAIRAFGGSNWSRERFEAANAYAQRTGKQGFTALSNHFGLAEAYDLPWAGCRHVTDEASKRWLTSEQIPLFPWASQARGFFARADPDQRSDAELVRCYYSDANFERLRRARLIADERGTTPTAVALAFVLHQPFPTFAIIGPRSTLETHSSFAALSIDLSPADVAWLDLRTDDRKA